MNYRHHYHAGNFADVVKHVVLTILINALQRKETPFCLLDTHAGPGLYDLQAIESQKSQEYLQGIAKLWQQNVPDELRSYLDLVARCNEQTLRSYPGSPLLAKKLLRQHDRMVLCELHPTDAPMLKNLFLHDPQVAVHHSDGYLALKAFLPPKEKRGLVLIDPPFESPDEYERLFNNVTMALKRWPQGIYAIWYPIKNDHRHQLFCQQWRGIRVKHLCAEFFIHARDIANQLNGCGMLIINPPWQCDMTIKNALAPLHTYLADGTAPMPSVIESDLNI